MSGTLVGMEIPEVLVGIVPRVGSVWCWEPLKNHARETVRVTDVKWNGEEVWVESERIYEGLGPKSAGQRHWNELDRWVEATVFVRPAEGDE